VSGGFELHPAAVMLGVIVGLLYGLLAVGFVLIHRTSRFINLAHPQVGVFAAAVLTVATERWRLPYWVAFVGALVIGAAVSGFTEVTAMRRLRRAPAIVGVVATLGIGQILFLLSLIVGEDVGRVPQPSLLPSFTFGPLLLTPAHVGMLTLGPVSVVALGVFLRFTRAGTAMRAASSEESLARLVGIPARRAATAAWAIAGALSALVVILILPTLPLEGDAFGLGLVARGLAAAAIAGMRNLMGALVAGVGIGIFEQVLFWNVPRSGTVSLVVFALVLLALLVRTPQRSDPADRERWRTLGAAGQPRIVPILLGTALAAIAILTSSNATAVVMTGLGAYALVGLSVSIVSGLGGQLSLGQFAFAGVGGVASVLVVASTGNFFLGFAAAAAAAGVAAALVGLPALRTRGSLFAVTSLLFAFVAQQWLLTEPWTLGLGRDPGRPIVGGFAFETGRSYALFTLGVTAAGFLVARSLWRARFRLRLVSLRDNEAASRSLGMAPAATMLWAFGVAGAFAGVGGALYAHRSSFVSADTFPVSASILVVAIAALGGLGAPLGAAVGALYIVGIPLAVSLDSAGLAATAAGWLILLLYLPGGLSQGLALLAARLRPKPVRDFPPRRDVIELLGGTPQRDPPRRHLLSAHGLRRSFGDLPAVDDVSISVEEGEILALVGPNGAGKTTLLDLLSGFQRPESGHVRFTDQDVTAWPADRRAAAGLARSFQDPVLFPTLSVLETVRLAVGCEVRRGRTLLLRARARSETERAERLVEAVGLDAAQPAHELSQGMRRTLQLLCIAAVRPRILLLDEPSSGLAAPEVQALAVLLNRFREELGISLLVVSHELALVTSIADRVAMMEAGRIVWTGTPSEMAAGSRAAPGADGLRSPEG
jgi:ABC-type branched-subunit amino acid transport system ATPase component/ABC-type branched-subunit amino acid transport system permease subunit